MGRRKKDSLGEDLVHVTALFPWWAGVLLAVVSYFVLHAIASRPPPAMTTVAQISDSVSHTFFSGLAMAGQYLLPLLFFFRRCAVIFQATPSRAVARCCGKSRGRCGAAHVLGM